MPIETRTKASDKKNNLPKPGPYVAKITNYKDPTNMGDLEVVLVAGSVDDPEIQAQTFTVHYLSPFFGYTSVEFEGTNPRNFDDVQKSYGFWMVPPDIGTQVLVIFVDGDPNQGYWIGCIPSTFNNQMVPGIAATKDVYLTPEQELKYGTKNLPSAEFLKRNAKQQINPSAQQKPVHPFADRLLAQGLLIDDIRGVTSSSARRELPSMVFGISTPGPLDPNGRKGQIGYETKKTVPISRLGGSQLVMDDGDEKGLNELLRIRTRTGHQILLHNSSDLIYIANSKGTAWIELTSDGKIDIFAEDSISIHTKNDFNFMADRDINLEAGRNIRVKANQDMDLNVVGNSNLIVNGSYKVAIEGSMDETVVKDYKFTTGNNFQILATKKFIATAGADMNLSSVGDMKQSTGASFNIGASGNLLVTAAKIHLNGPAAAAATAATLAAMPTPLPNHNLPNRIGDAEWTNGNFYKSDDLVSIMKRVPTHEPWDHHENINPDQFKPASTDASSS